MISLFVRYFLTITPPLPDNENKVRVTRTSMGVRRGQVARQFATIG